MYARVTRELPQDFAFWAKSLRGQNIKYYNSVKIINVKIEMQVVKAREVKDLNLFTRKKLYVHDNRMKTFLCNIGSQS